MSKMIPVALFAVLALTFLLLAVSPASTNSNNVIIVNNADAVRQASFSAHSGLSSRLEQVAARIRVQYANVLRRLNLIAPSQQFMNTLGSVHDRIRLSYANTSRRFTLSYPADLIDDNSKPIISNVAGSAAGLISWTTDEFATSTVRYGTSPGVYPSTVNSSLFAKQHQLQLTGIQTGVRYYYVVSSVDLSGNTATSGEYVLTQSYSLFLPSVLRHTH